MLGNNFYIIYYTFNNYSICVYYIYFTAICVFCQMVYPEEADILIIILFLYIKVIMIFVKTFKGGPVCVYFTKKQLPESFYIMIKTL